MFDMDVEISLTVIVTYYAYDISLNNNQRIMANSKRLHLTHCPGMYMCQVQGKCTYVMLYANRSVG